MEGAAKCSDLCALMESFLCSPSRGLAAIITESDAGSFGATLWMSAVSSGAG